MPELSLQADRPLGKVLINLLDLLILQVLFLITSIPVFTIGAGLSALFSVCRKMQEDVMTPVIKTYFASFKSCFKKGTLAWLVLAAAGALLAIAASYYYSMEGLFRLIPLALSCVLLLLVWLEFLYIFPLIGWYDNTLANHFINAPVMAAYHILTTLALTALYAFVFWAALEILQPLFLISFSGCAYYADLLLRKAFRAHDIAVPEQEPESEKPAPEDMV